MTVEPVLLALAVLVGVVVGLVLTYAVIVARIGGQLGRVL